MVILFFANLFSHVILSIWAEQEVQLLRFHQFRMKQSKGDVLC